MAARKRGERSGGRLKEAKMVRQSRMVKRAKVGRRTARVVLKEAEAGVEAEEKDEAGAEKSLVNWLSL